MKKMTYAEAGVDIEKGDRFAAFIASIDSPAVSRSLGGFSGGLPFDARAYREPLLFSTTDGVGTKLLVAQKLGVFDSIGIDLVAMCVNDLAVCNVRPMSFLDYIACGSVTRAPLHEIMRGIVRGCELAGCTLAGGETAEMPDLYGENDFDLAGFCCGIAEKADVRPHTEPMRAGDLLYGLASSGIHSNGLSLARKLVADSDEAGWKELLAPTRIYVRELLSLFACRELRAAAHITGGGLAGNLQRVLKDCLRPSFSWDWPQPAVFDRLRRAGVEEAEMRRVFNLGVGVALVVSREGADDFERRAASEAIALLRLGELVDG